nr:MAG TPA: hypothetical protein [Herelleviridae sp.]
MELLKYEIKRGKDVLFDFNFSKNDENVYNLKYNLYYDKIEKYFKKNDELGLYVKGLLGRIFSGFYLKFKLKPQTENQGFDFSLDWSFTGVTDEKEFIDLFKEYQRMLEMVLKKSKILLTGENKNVIISYFENENIDNSVEHFIVVDKKTNELYELKDIDIQRVNEIGVYLTVDDVVRINKMKYPVFIHNHQNNLIFSENDKKSYEKLKEVITKKFDFMIYSVGSKQIIDYKTGLITS